jgi:hypothetical protein
MDMAELGRRRAIGRRVMGDMGIWAYMEFMRVSYRIGIYGVD